MICPERGVFVETMRKLLKRAYVFVATAAVFIYLTSPISLQAEGAVPQAVFMKITAYSSSPDETDSTPFITADGTRVHRGVVASNVLPFGTKIEIPALFGNEVFTVEDRMSPRIKNTIDIWMPSKTAALRFGAHYANILILPNQNGISLRAPSPQK